MATQQEVMDKLAQATDAAASLMAYFSQVRDDIFARLNECSAKVTAFINSGRSEFPTFNLVTEAKFKLNPKGEGGDWVGFTFAENGVGDGPDNWNFTEEFIPLNQADAAVIDLVQFCKLSSYEREGWYLRKLTITKRGLGPFETGLNFGAGGNGIVSGGFAMRVNDSDWQLHQSTKRDIPQHAGDWGAQLPLSDLQVGDTVYMALPFVCPGVPGVLPFPISMLTVLAKDAS
ncbi:hypothetical protein [Algicola sagamiensis]|uniref:hypothetical protein n=1 Tax=Algicola sagamiensis TaxID=163869 RepID=UPI00037BDDA8|nr:hypothetical protein [Algicola sagamiensis]